MPGWEAQGGVPWALRGSEDTAAPAAVLGPLHTCFLVFVGGKPELLNVSGVTSWRGVSSAAKSGCQETAVVCKTFHSLSYREALRKTCPCHPVPRDEGAVTAARQAAAGTPVHPSTHSPTLLRMCSPSVHSVRAQARPGVPRLLV